MAMPLLHSEEAPYYSGCSNNFKEFLQEFEVHADVCRLMDQQCTEAIIHYIAPSMHNFWRSLDSYNSYDTDWLEYQQYLVDIFGRITLCHEAMRQDLLGFVKCTSRIHMHCEDDVLWYYRLFLVFSKHLVPVCHLTADERNLAFWCGFHPNDCSKLWLHLLAKIPYQPKNAPFCVKNVLTSAHAAFAHKPAQ